MGYYNHDRAHSFNDYLSPVKFEQATVNKNWFPNSNYVNKAELYRRQGSEEKAKATLEQGIK